METDQLLAFLTVADYLNFSRAAEALYISQPTLSKQIIRLENELGVPLFIRSRRSVSLTPQGRKILPIARHIVEYTSLLKENIDAPEADSTASSIFCVGIDERLLQNTACQLKISQALNLLQKSYTDTRIVVNHLLDTEISSSVLQRQNDACITLRYEIIAGERINCSVFLEDTLMLMIAKDALSRLQAPDLPHIFSEMKVYRQSQDPDELAAFEQIAHAFSDAPIIEYFDNVNLSFLEICAGNGIMLVPKAFMNELTTDFIEFIPIPREIARISYSMLWLKSNMHPCISELNSLLCNTMKS